MGNQKEDMKTRLQKSDEAIISPDFFKSMAYSQQLLAYSL